MRVPVAKATQFFSDNWLSTETLRASQLRLYFSPLAYVLVHALRRLVQVETLRLRLPKIAAAEVRFSARRIWACCAPLPLESALRRRLRRLEWLRAEASAPKACFHASSQGTPRE